MTFVDFAFLIQSEHYGTVYQTDIVVQAESVSSFKGRLDRFWDDQELKFNCKADIKGSLPEAEVI